MPKNEGCFLVVGPPHRIVWTGMLSAGFRPQTQSPLGFGFVCDLTFSALPQGGSLFEAWLMHLDAEGTTKHEQMGFDQGWRVALSQLTDLYGVG